MTVNILPNAKTQFFDENGVPVALGQVFMYVPNTDTFKTTWQDFGGTIANTNPIDLDAAGEALIWGSGAYRQVVYDALGNLVWDQITTDPSYALVASLSGTSTTSVTIGTGAKSFTTQLGLAFFPGQNLIIASNASAANYMTGTVTSYNTSTGALVMNITTTGGSGTYADWNISITGVKGSTGSVSTTGSPVSGNLTKFSGTTAITNADLTGDVTTSGTVATTIAANAVTNAKFRQSAASTLVGNATGGSANVTDITIGATLAFSGTALQTAAITGDVTASANSFVTTVAKINGATLGTTTATSGNILIGSGTAWVTNPITGDITLSSAGVTAVAKINGVTVSGTTGTGNVVFSASPTLTGTVNGAAAIWSGNSTAAAFIPSGSSVPANGIYLPSANVVGFSANSLLGLSVSSVASAVNSIRMINSTTGNYPVIRAIGTDSIIGLNLQSTSSGSIYMETDGAATPLVQCIFSHTALAVNQLTITGAATGGRPSITATGTDTDIDILATPKGAGVFKTTAISTTQPTTLSTDFIGITVSGSTVTSAGGNNIGGIKVNASTISSTSAGIISNIEIAATTFSGTADGTFNAIKFAMPTITSTSTGFGTVQGINITGATVSTATGFQSSINVINIGSPTAASAGSVTTYRTLNIANQGAAGIGTSDAIFISAQSGSATASYAFRVSGGLSINGNGNIAVNTAALATNATTGFMFMSVGNGTPTGAPTLPYANSCAWYYDYANNIIYVYNGNSAAWKKTAALT